MNENVRRTVVLHLNTEDVEKKMKNLTTRLENARREKEALEKKATDGGKLTAKETLKLRDYTKEVNECERSLNRMRSTKEQVDIALKNLSSAGPKELKNTLKSLNRELESGNIKRGSKEWDAYRDAIVKVETELRKIKDEQKAVASGWTRFNNIIQTTANIAMTIQGAWQFMTGITSTLRQHVQTYAEMEEAMADVRKYTGMTVEQVEDLNEELKKMDTRTSREQLNALAGDAGRLGIQSKQEILDFVEAANQINVALGEELGKDAVKNIGKLAQLYGDDQTLGLKQAMLSTGSAINELAQHSSAAEPYILDFTARLAGIGKQAGISQADIMGFAASLDEGMLRDEMASTAMANLITKMFQDPAKLANAAGLEVKAFAELIKNDANAALIQYFETMNSKGGFASLAPMFKEMGLDGSRATQVLANMANQIENVKENQLRANEAYEEAVSITNEYNVKNNTVEAQLEKARNRVHELSYSLGKELYPIMSKGLHLTSNLINVSITLLRWVKQNKSALLSIATAVVALTIAVKAETIARYLSISAIRAHITSLGEWIATSKLAQALQTIGNNLMNAGTIIVESIKLAYYRLTGAQMEATKAQLALNTAMQSNPLGAVITVIASLVAAVTAAIGVMQLFSKSTKETTDSQKALKEAQREGGKQAEVEITKLKRLYDATQNQKLAMNQRLAAAEALKKQYPSYFGKLTNEAILAGKAANAYRKLTQQIVAAANARAMESKLEELAKRRYELQRAVYADTRWLAENPEQEGGPTGFAVDYSGRGMMMGNTTFTVTDRKSSERARRQNALDKNKKAIAALDKSMQSIANELNRNQEFINKAAEEASSTAENLNSFNKKSYGGGGSASNSDNGGSATRSTGKHDKKTDKPDPQNTAEKELKKKQEEIEKLLLLHQLAKKELYEMGEIDLREYEKQMLIIEGNRIIKMQELYEKGSKEYNEYEIKRFEHLQKIYQQQYGWSTQDLEREEKEANAAAQRNFLNGKTNEEEYQEELTKIRLRFLQRRADLAKQFGQKDADKLQAQADEAELKEQQKRREEYLQKAQKFQQEYEKKSLDEQKEDELKLLEELIKAKVISTENGEKYKQQIIDKYDKKKKEKAKQEKEEKDKDAGKVDKKEVIEKFGGNVTDAVSQSVITLGEALQNLNAKLKDGEAKWQDWAAVAMASMVVISNMMNSVSSYYQAAQDAETAKIEKKYDTEIQRAGSNSRRGKKLEEKKQKELAAIKNKYNKKMQTIELAQAVASTAMAAINAYASAAKIPMIGHIMAPIAAAMALAAGALQIATIKKQHAAQSAGYYAGGFTGGSNYRREAGVVHQGEFVANHAAVNNPNVLPVLRLIDYAQRNNTVASLTAADVSRAVGANAMTATTIRNASAPVVIDSAQPRTAEALERLNDILAEPIKSYVTIDGNDGVAYNLNRYNKLKARK